MQLTRRKLALLIGTPLLLIVIGVGGYFAYGIISEQQSDNGR